MTNTTPPLSELGTRYNKTIGGVAIFLINKYILFLFLFYGKRKIDCCWNSSHSYHASVVASLEGLFHIDLAQIEPIQT